MVTGSFMSTTQGGDNHRTKVHYTLLLSSKTACQEY